MGRTLKRLWWLVVDLLHGLLTEPPLILDDRRLNLAIQHEKSAQDRTVDPVYKQRIIDRMTQGKKCQHPPLYNRPVKVRRRRRNRKVAAFPKTA